MATLPEILAILERYVFLIYDFVVPKLFWIISTTQKSLQKTDFNSWNPKSCMWTIVFLLMIFIVVKSVRYVMSLVSAVVYMVVLSIAVQFIIKSINNNDQSSWFHQQKSKNDWGF